MSNFVDINRFWCYSKSKITLDLNGFLPDYIGSWSQNSNIMDFTTINKKRCVIFLGESGAGKSYAIKKDVDKLSLNNQKEIVIYIDLSEFSDENRLINSLFNSEQIKEWKSSKDNLILFIDSFDECLLQIPKLTSIIKKQLDVLSSFSERLKIRIICRSGYWNNTLSDYLSTFFNEELSIVEIAPLKYNDIYNIAAENGIDAKSFMPEIIRKGFQAFAINFTTLHLLISYYKINNLLPDNKDDMYYEGCRMLCTEPNLDRQVNSKYTSLSPEKKLAIASRVAAIMIFCDKPKVTIRQNIINDKHILYLRDIQEGTEFANLFSFHFTQNDVIETITETALFSYYDEGVYTFYHRTYAEYLAAKYIVSHQLSLSQILSLITLSSDTEKKAVEQLKGTASWIGTLSPSFMLFSIEKDPLNLLPGNIENISNDNKKKLVQSILDKLDSTDITNFDFSLKTSYHKLKHVGVVSQIRPYIANNTYSFSARKFAIDIIISCDIHDLCDELISVLENTNENIRLREMAAQALSEIAPLCIIKKITKYVTSEHIDDDNDEIKGIVLQAVWPKILTTEDVFKHLTYPKRENFIGTYRKFINYDLVSSLSITTINHALSWLINNLGETNNSYDSLEVLKNNIIYFCWENFFNLSFYQKDLFAKSLFKIMKNYGNINPTPQRYLGNEPSPVIITAKHRKEILGVMLPRIKKEELDFLFYNDIIDRNEDFDFIVHSYRQLCDSNDMRAKYAYILYQMNFYSSIERIDILINLYQNDNSDLHFYFKDILEPIELNSEKAKKIKNEYESRLAFNKKCAEMQSNNSCQINVSEKILSNIDNYESTGDRNHCIQLFMNLTLKPNSKYYGDRFISNVTLLDAWNNLLECEKERIINLSERYVKENKDCYEKWFGKDLFNYAATTGYKCLILLMQFKPAFIQEASTTLLNKWIHIIVCYPESFGFSKQEQHFLNLISISYAKSPDLFLEIITNQIIHENSKENAHLFILNKINHCADDKMLDHLFEIIAKSNTLKENCKTALVSFLLDKNCDKIKDYCLQYITNSNDDFSNSIASILMVYSRENELCKLFDKIDADDAYAENVYLKFASHHDSKRSVFLENTSDQRLAKSYIQLCKLFPTDEDPQFEGIHFIGPREDVANFRNQILATLVNNGAVESIEKIVDMVHNTDLKYSLIAARNNYRKNNWNPLLPVQFLKLIGNTKMKVVSNHADLLDLIIESLDRLEERLQKENSLSFALWNESYNKLESPKQFTPKKEEELSDFIKDHLKTDIEKYGISAYREVQLRRPNTGIPGGKKGETTDIYVSLSNGSMNSEISVIIEVKGSWNTGVNTSIDTQLCNRYLDTANTSYGLYLIGWFVCEAQCNNSNKTGAVNIEEARTLYSAKASELSKGSKTIKSYILDCRLKN